MKKATIISLFAAFIAAGNVGDCGTVDAPYEVGTWSGFKTAAITWTFDDGCTYQFSRALPMFDANGFKMTFYPVPSWSPPWDKLQAAAAEGHEVGSHTVDHHLADVNYQQQIYELSQSQIIVDSCIPGNQCVTIAYPNCNEGNEPLIAQYYIAGRNCSSGLISATPSNFYQIGCHILGSCCGNNTLASITSKIDAAGTAGGWCVFLIHDLDDGSGFSPLPSTVLSQSLQYLAARRNTCWVETFRNVVRYIKERNDATVTELSNTGNTITLQVTDTLNDAIFSYPLTIRRPLPAGWESAKVSQNGQPVTTSFVDVNSVKYMMLDVVPDGGNVVLIKAPAAPANLTEAAGLIPVSLDWNDNNTVDLAGYNIYRSTTSGGSYTKMNGSLLSGSNYVDDTVGLDTVYYYVATAVDVNSIESGYSNEVSGGIYGDFTGNHIVGLTDLPGFFHFWVLNDCDETDGVDLDEDCTVNFYEFAILAENWMQTP